MDWQPISTAPRDGTRVILVEADKPGEACIGWWIEGQWRDYGDIGCNGLEDFLPTHWMPVPFVPEDIA